jgi:L-alanine-DL-glutamate epimerase-like enolase superfamily enzyme
MDILRDRRHSLVACGGVDIAIWDAVGKLYDQPLWRLWGGARRVLPMIAIGGYYDDDLTAQLEALLALGVAGVKLKVGGRSPEEDAERFVTARQVLGEERLLGADANQGWTIPEAVRFARLAGPSRVDWFEEPCRWDNDRLAMRDVRNATGLLVTAGQSEFASAGCRDLMAAGAIDICNFDASWSGGATEWRRAASVAATYGVQMGHHEEPQVASHLLASIEHSVFVECFSPERDPIWWGLVANRPPLEDGQLRLSDRPGLGWELDQEFIERHSVARPRITDRKPT